MGQRWGHGMGGSTMGGALHTHPGIPHAAGLWGSPRSWGCHQLSPRTPQPPVTSVVPAGHSCPRCHQHKRDIPVPTPLPACPHPRGLHPPTPSIPEAPSPHTQHPPPSQRGAGVSPGSGVSPVSGVSPGVGGVPRGLRGGGRSPAAGPARRPLLSAHNKGILQTSLPSHLTGNVMLPAPPTSLPE